MPEFINHLRATFEPTDCELLTTTPTSKLLVDHPILASALSQIFPYLLLVDSILETITWTNDDYYRNFLIMTLYSCIIVYWDLVSHAILPLLAVTLFSFIVWSISSVIYDSKYNEKPTIEEVLYTLHNITVRTEMIFRPIKKFPFTVKNYTRLFIVSILLTPVHWVLVKTILPPQRYIWFAGLFIFSFNSPYSFAMRQLLWRSLYLRLAIVYITGVDFKITKPQYQEVSMTQSSSASDYDDSNTSSSTPLLSNFKIVRKKMISPTQLKQTVLFEVLENERRWLGIGWSSLLYPSERQNFCYQNTLQAAPDITINANNFPFPMFENDVYSYQWEWAEDRWHLDLEFNKCKAKDGWVYYNNNWECPRYCDGFSKYTRSRKWVRKAYLVIDKRGTVYDE
ncbi:hypothetical protein KGF56_003582 [Candida oxycetoniae]|uniref:Peroxin/Ferlin domain-containing protein n=1 Tax=Candida oxycetoniae TaxID=497107 RepID=A0AAI9WXD7_9ASCO|nr:uncharacterized protein KGF56_003582 [Candida oxycetoniae]KAI3403655.2 hypothetical protein KGF56_003582 [Candida oxycetoniae]